MKPNYDTTIPGGFHQLNPYLFTADPERLITFLKQAFDAKELSRTMDDKGEIIRNCILSVGDSSLMIAQASADFMGMRTSLYLYVDNPDEVHQLALDHGAKDVCEPMDMDYGDRQGGVIDPAGNYWGISKHLQKGYY